MSQVRSILGIVAVALTLALSGCGGSDSHNALPAELVGTYTTTLEDGDIRANAPSELESGKWELVIATSGAPDGGPALAIKNPREGKTGTLEAPGLTVDGDRFLLEDEECWAGTPAASAAFYDNEYGWALDGANLTLTTVKNACTDRVAETILTSRSWTKQ